MDINVIIEQHQGLIYTIAKHFHPKNHTELEEYIQEGNIALWRAICKFDSTYNTKISTMAWKYIYRAIARYIATENKVKHKYKNTYNTSYIIISSPLWEYIPDDLSEKECQIIKMKFEGYTFDEIGKYFGFTKNWAFLTYNKILTKLKKAN